VGAEIRGGEDVAKSMMSRRVLVADIDRLAVSIRRPFEHETTSAISEPTGVIMTSVAVSSANAGQFAG
jgi:hypothetical protein